MIFTEPEPAYALGPTSTNPGLVGGEELSFGSNEKDPSASRKQRAERRCEHARFRQRQKLTLQASIMEAGLPVAPPPPWPRGLPGKEPARQDQDISPPE